MLPDNWPVIQLFLAVANQWRVGAMGGVMGLDYAAVDVVIRYRRLTVTPEMFIGLQIMEMGAVEALNERKPKHG